MSTQLVYNHDDEDFTVSHLKDLAKKLLTLDGVTNDTPIESIRLKFSNNKPLVTLDSHHHIIICD